MYIQRLDRAYFTSPSFNKTCYELYTHLTVRCRNLIEIAESKSDTEEASVMQHCRTVSFIYKTVVEFLRQEYESDFNDHACLSTVSGSVARAKMGLLFLAPLTKPFKGVYEYQAGEDGNKTKDDSHNYNSHNYELVSQCVPDELKTLVLDLRSLVQDIMLTMSFGEYFAGNAESGRQVDNVQTDLTSHMLRILLHLTNSGGMIREITSNKTCPAKFFLSMIKRGERYSDAETQHPLLFQNGCNFAAFWGWRSYIRSRVCGEVFGEDLENLFANASIGLSHWSGDDYKFGGLQDAWCVPMASLQTVGFLLQSGRVQLDKLSPWRPCRQLGYGIRDASTMGAFFISVSQAITGYHRLKGWHDEKEARITFGLDLIKQSQLPGFHCNPRLGLAIQFGFTSFHEYDPLPYVDLLVDETPLANLQHETFTKSKVLQSLRDTLRSMTPSSGDVLGSGSPPLSTITESIPTIESMPRSRRN